MRPLLARVVNSKRVISEIVKPSPFLHSSSIAALAYPERRLGSNASQTTTWVSTRILEVPPVFDYGRNDIADNHTPAPEEVVDLVTRLTGGDKFRHGLAVFRDDDGLPLGLNLVHNRKAMYLERTCCHGLHPELLTIVT
jgi:hypothetical protein